MKSSQALWQGTEKIPSAILLQADHGVLYTPCSIVRSFSLRDLREFEGLAMSFTAQHLFFDDVGVGQEWESLGRTITEADIVNFAGLSGDFNPIHIDHEFARTTPFRKPIAHGLLILSIGSGLILHCPPMRTLAFLGIVDWHFADAVFIGDTIRVRGRVVAKEERGRGKRGVITWHRAMVNQAGKVVQHGQTQTLVEARAARRDSRKDGPARETSSSGSTNGGQTERGPVN